VSRLIEVATQLEETAKGLRGLDASLRGAPGTSIETLPGFDKLSVRARKALAAADIRTIGALGAATCDEFITQPGVGIAITNELTDWAKSCGMELA
jgi:hypothetical protein